MRAPLAFATAVLLGVAFSAGAANATCKRFGFTVNDYGKEGPTKDAKDLLDKHIAEWAAQQGIKEYKTGAKSVNCELFLNFVVFDEHTCTASANVCWNDGKGGSTPDAATEAEAGAPPMPIRKASLNKGHDKKSATIAADAKAATPSATEAAPASPPTSEAAAAAPPATEATPPPAASEPAKVTEPPKAAETTPPPASPPPAVVETGTLPKDPLSPLKKQTATAPDSPSPGAPVKSTEAVPESPPAATPPAKPGDSKKDAAAASAAATAAAAAAERAAVAAETAAAAAKEAAAAAVAASAASKGAVVPPLDGTP